MSRRTLCLASWSTMACLSFALTGCSNDEPEPAQQPVNVARSQPQRRPNILTNKDADKPAETTPEVIDPEAGYPAELAEWSDDDFRKAREINHSRLVMAINERADGSEDDADDAKFWMELLAIEPPSQGRAPAFANQSDPRGPSAGGRSSISSGDVRGQRDTMGDGLGDFGEQSGGVARGDGIAQGDMDLGDMDRGDMDLDDMDRGGGELMEPGRGPGRTGSRGESTAESTMGKGSAQEIVKTLIDVSINNSTDLSLETLTGVMSGKVSNGTADGVMVGFVLDSLQESSRDEHQQLILEALLQPGKFRNGSGDDDSVTALDLQKEAFAKLEGAKLSALKNTLAERVGDANPANAAQPIIEYLLKDDFDNLEAQVTLYQSGAITNKDLRAELRDLLASYSKSAFNRLMGLTAAPVMENATNSGAGQGNNDADLRGDVRGGFGGDFDGGDVRGGFGGDFDGGDVRGGFGGDVRGGFDGGEMGEGGRPIGGRGTGNNTNNTPRRGNLGLRAIPLSDQQVQDVAGLLWTKEFEATVLAELETANSMEDVGDGLKLAGVLPMHAVRRRLAKMVEDNWQNGVENLAQLGIFSGILHDPGMLLVSKTAPTNFPLRFNPNRTPPGASSLRAKWDENKLKFDWFTEIYNQVETQTQLYRDAPGFSNSLGSSVSHVRLHRGADKDVEAVFESSWPDDVSRQTGGAELDPLKVQYIRIRTLEPIARVRGHYANALRKGQNYPLAQPGGAWLTHTETDLEKGVSRSIDVFVKPGGSVGGGRNVGSGDFGGGDFGGDFGGGRGGGRRGPGRGQVGGGVIVEILVIETPAISG
ncbi:MAG: hypothetical protein MPJ50_07480 [Pirellulales bacterium]|nr:hypothetical protein [Pirellulales bacterium]